MTKTLFVYKGVPKLQKVTVFYCIPIKELLNLQLSVSQNKLLRANIFIFYIYRPSEFTISSILCFMGIQMLETTSNE
jgi:hypothetical protein